MATSIISYNKKNIDVNDNVLLFSLYFIKCSSEGMINKPEWFVEYTEKVIDSMLQAQPIGWGYMDLEEYLDTISKKLVFIEILDKCIIFLKNRDLKVVNHEEANQILNLKEDKWKEVHYVDIEFIIKFLEDVKILLDEKTPLNHPRLMKTNF